VLFYGQLSAGWLVCWMQEQTKTQTRAGKQFTPTKEVAIN